MNCIDFEYIENKIINKEELNEYELRACAWGEVGKYIDEREGNYGRWTKAMSTIFEVIDQLYRIDWEKGLTKCQDNMYRKQPYKVRREEKVVTTTVVSYVKMED